MKAEFTLTIEMGNAAMLTRYDIAEALHKVARQIGDSNAIDADSGLIHDGNGNKVGKWTHDELPTEDDDED